MLDATSYESACEISSKHAGKKISKQTWAIVPKIREVDDILQTRQDLRDRTFEVHPELSFATWSGAPMSHPKSRLLGMLDRLRLIESHFGEGLFETARESISYRDCSDDDILDAFSALWTAERIAKETARTIPEDVSPDSTGLPM